MSASRYCDQLVRLLQEVTFFNGAEGVDTIPGAEHAAYLLFQLIASHHGKDEAYRILNKLGTPPSRARLAKINNLGLLDLYDFMRPKPNVQQLAWRLGSENAKLPQSQRLGPRGTTNPMTMDKHLRRLIRERRARGEGKEHDEV
jgi:hypothetical protein